MDFYLWIVKPSIGIVTNVFPTHTEFFGDINGVYKEKSKLISNLPKNGLAILNGFNIFTKNMAKISKAKVIFFEIDDNPEITNKNIVQKVSNSLKVKEEIIEKGLKNYNKPKHRLSKITHISGAFILDDSYNSNPEALLATLKYFDKLSGNNKKIAVIGDMLELGKLTESEHKRVGKEIEKYKFDVIIGVGKHVTHLINEIKTSNCKTYIVSDQKDVLPILLPFLVKNSYILIKGSRSIYLDKVVDKLI